MKRLKINIADIERKKKESEDVLAEIGVLITLEEATQPMRTEAASCGFYKSIGWGKSYPVLQIQTVKELLAGGEVDYPPSKQVNVTFKKAGRSSSKGGENMKLEL